MANDARLDRDLNAAAQALERIERVARELRQHLPDIQLIAWDQSHPDSNYPASLDPEEAEAENSWRAELGLPPIFDGATRADRCRALIKAMSGRNGLRHLENTLVAFAAAAAKQFAGPAPDDELRGTLLGNDDSDGHFLPHSPGEEMKRLIGYRNKRLANAPRTGETAHVPIEQQKEAPKERGVDNNLNPRKSA